MLDAQLMPGHAQPAAIGLEQSIREMAQDPREIGPITDSPPALRLCFGVARERSVRVGNAAVLS